MNEVSQGPEWWQAADRKRYPPRHRPEDQAPLPPPPTLPPPMHAYGRRKVGFVLALAGLALAFIAFKVVTLYGLGAAFPAVAVEVAIAIIGVTIVVAVGWLISRWFRRRRSSPDGHEGRRGRPAE
jgi:hypothetical protein